MLQARAAGGNKNAFLDVTGFFFSCRGLMILAILDLFFTRLKLTSNFTFLHFTTILQQFYNNNQRMPGVKSPGKQGTLALQGTAGAAV